MSIVEATLADRAGRIEEASALYEEAIAASAPPLFALMNLAILYWQATDYGFSTGSNLARPFITRAGVRFGELLSEAAKMFPQSVEPRFWQQYIAWVDLGAPLSPQECRDWLAQDPSVLIPSMHLFVVSRGSECADKALVLLDECRADGTIRSKYIASVIEGALKRRTGNRKN